MFMFMRREKPLLEGEETLVEDLFTYRLDITFGILMPKKYHKILINNNKNLFDRRIVFV
jgi:hypothetical protein